jgi:hypothetical protein
VSEVVILTNTLRVFFQPSQTPMIAHWTNTSMRWKSLEADSWILYIKVNNQALQSSENLLLSTP